MEEKAKNQEEKNKEVKKKAKKVSIPVFIFSIALFLAVLVIALGIFIYQFNIKNEAVRRIEKIIPYPAAVINYTNFIPLSELDDNLKSVKNFYESQEFSKAGIRIDFSTPEGENKLKIKEKEILNKMIEDGVIEILAKKNGIKITEKGIDDNIKAKMDEFGSRERVVKNLSELYGWSISDFKEKIVKAELYREGLEKIYLERSRNEDSKAKKKIEEAEKQLQEKKDFSQVASAYSEGFSAKEGGDLGWFKKEQLIPEISEEIFSLKKGEQSKILESILGFHIVKVEEEKMENEEKLIRIKQIFTGKKTFADWLEEEMANFSVLIPMGEYKWDENNLTVSFEDAKMAEEEVRIKNELAE